MVKTNSMFVELGSSLPNSNKMLNINLPKAVNFDFSELDDRHLFIMFICAHCPFVKHIEEKLTSIIQNFQDDVQTIAVSSNDIKTYPDDSPENLKRQALLNNWTFPYLYDEDQSFAKQLKAACTPDFYLFANNGNAEFSLFYHGQLDKSRPSNKLPVTGEDLISAVNAILNHKDYQPNQIPSLGCNIKWTPGNEPDWFK
tara:strand:+ start:2966 stop:3562 length:597 start_codon:yes stop_codon:yes gene_type:complete